MSDLYNELIDELEKCDIFVRYSTIEPKTILDLSEHDKPFKVKIRELEESYQKNVREIHTLEKDNLFFKKRITEIENKRNKMYEISKILRKNCNNFYKENKELKQSIAELERSRSEWADKAVDKIAELEKEVVNYKQAFEDKCTDYGVASELLGKYQRENEALKKRIQELDAIDAMRIDEKRELKQRIAELESKETEKPTKINLNDRIKVKLTPLGAEIYYHMFDDTNKKAKKTIIEPHLPKVDEKGYTEFTLWGFINTYGQYIKVGEPNVIDPIDIIACE